MKELHVPVEAEIATHVRENMEVRRVHYTSMISGVSCRVFVCRCVSMFVSVCVCDDLVLRRRS